jgi:hypothetical protein
MERWSGNKWRAMLARVGLSEFGSVRAILEDSMERKACVSKMWAAKGGAGLDVVAVTKQMKTSPVLNETTHFSCVMDPAVTGGGLVWVEAYGSKPDDGDEFWHDGDVSTG